VLVPGCAVSRYRLLLTALVQLEPATHVTFVGYTVVADLAAVRELGVIPVAIEFPLIEHDGCLATQGVNHTGILLGGVHRVHPSDIVTHLSLLQETLPFEEM